MEKKVKKIILILFAEHFVKATDRQLLVETLAYQVSNLLEKERKRWVEEIKRKVEDLIRAYKGLYDEAPVVNEALNELLNSLEKEEK